MHESGGAVVGVPSASTSGSLKSSKTNAPQNDAEASPIKTEFEWLVDTPLTRNVRECFSDRLRRLGSLLNPVTPFGRRTPTD